MIKHKISVAFLAMVKYTLSLTAYAIVLGFIGVRWIFGSGQLIHDHDKLAILVMTFLIIPLIVLAFLFLPTSVLMFCMWVLMFPLTCTIAFIAWYGWIS